MQHAVKSSPMDDVEEYFWGKICQGQLQTIYSEFPKFHPNPFSSGGVIAERVNIVQTRHKVFAILGEASASSSRKYSVLSIYIRYSWFLDGYLTSVTSGVYVLSIYAVIVVLFMVALCNRETIYIFMLWFLSIYLFFPRLISAAGDWMSSILPHMLWP